MSTKRLLLAAVLCLIPSFISLGQSLYQDGILHKQPPKVPQYVTFAGDTIRFDRSDMYERMDRELIAFTYMHTNSLLMLKRSNKYFSMVVPILKKNGIPEDLKYLMAIESNLDPHARSTAGAIGLWQFTKSTATQYGLEVGTEVDERYHIEKETEAACKFLKEAKAKYKDWMTVAASYNAGQGGISRRIADQGEDSALDLLLVEETSRYMFRILVAKLFFENPQSFGFFITDDEKYPYIAPKKTVDVTGSIPSLVDFAKNNGVTYRQLKEANLWLRDTKLTNKTGKKYTITIPQNK